MTTETALLGYDRGRVRAAGGSLALIAGVSLLFVHPQIAAYSTVAEWASLLVHGIAVAFVVYTLALDIQRWRET